MSKKITLWGEDINWNTRPGLWKTILSELGVQPDADRLILELSDTDTNAPAFDNLFSLCYDTDEDERKAIMISAQMKNILDRMITDVNAVIECPEGGVKNDIMEVASLAIKAFHWAGVGVGDTATDECIIIYIEDKIKTDDFEGLIDRFYDMIHYPGD